MEESIADGTNRSGGVRTGEWSLLGAEQTAVGYRLLSDCISDRLYRRKVPRRSRDEATRYLVSVRISE